MVWPGFIWLRMAFVKTGMYFWLRFKKCEVIPVTGRGGPPIRLWGVEAPTFSRQPVQRWRWGCQPYAPAVGAIKGQRISSHTERLLSLQEGHLRGFSVFFFFRKSCVKCLEVVRSFVTHSHLVVGSFVILVACFHGTVIVDMRTCTFCAARDNAWQFVQLSRALQQFPQLAKASLMSRSLATCWHELWFH
jgi:hypothetical protein